MIFIIYQPVSSQTRVFTQTAPHRSMGIMYHMMACDCSIRDLIRVKGRNSNYHVSVKMAELPEAQSSSSGIGNNVFDFIRIHLS